MTTWCESPSLSLSSYTFNGMIIGLVLLVSGAFGLKVTIKRKKTIEKLIFGGVGVVGLLIFVVAFAIILKDSYNCYQ